ncbi:MarR family transcriptional regulator [Amnibacterium flavum]|uniref:MarR family transcriptional regulator n=1 Tax=Amnibacterium flavum TaxID=2173173 RepID=A0A2V1HQW1_9MICO|nr:MarR family transcriptional regulator [Amnibacterium flavum]
MATTDAGEDLLALDNQVCFALAVASRSVIALYRPLLEPLGVTHPQYLVLLALWGRDGMTMGELSSTLRLEPATLSPLLKRLEAIGYVSRGRRPSDERVLEVTLTQAGHDARATAERIPAQVVERLGLPMERLESLRDALHLIIAASA